MPVSFNPTTFVEGGLIDDFVGRVKKAWTAIRTRNDGVQAPAFFMLLEHGEGFAEQYEAFWSAGDLARMAPTPDGEGFNEVGDATSLSKSSNSGLLFSSLAANGISPALLDQGKASLLEGMVAHFKRQKIERKGLAPNAPKKPGGRDLDDPGTLLIKEIKTFPPAMGGATPASVKTTATAAAPTSAPAAGGGAAPTVAANATPEQLDEALMQAVVDTAAANGGKLTRKDLLAKVFSYLNKSPKLRDYAKSRVLQDEFLAAGPWTYEADVLTPIG